MGRRKDSTALFEAISRSKPGSMSAATPQAGGPPALPDAGPAPMVHLTFSRGAGVVSVVVLAGLLVGAFYVGRATVPKVARQAQGRQAAGDVPDGNLPLPPAPNAWKEGSHYLIIKAMEDDTDAARDRAIAIVNWLRENKGVEADVLKIRPKDSSKVRWAVMSKKGFATVPVVENRDHSIRFLIPEAKKFAEEIEGYGKEYLRLSGKYDFGQTLNGRLNPWYTPYNPRNQ